MTIPAPVLAELRVLVIEDQYYIAMELKRLIMQRGGQVLGPTRDMDSAASFLEPRPDLAILDVNLNDKRVYPMAEVLRDLGTPFIFATGYEPWARRRLCERSHGV